MKLWRSFVIYVFTITCGYAIPNLEPTPPSPILFEVNGPTLTVTLTNTGNENAATINLNNFNSLFSVTNDTCTGNVITFGGGTCTFDLTPLLNASSMLMTIPVPYQNSDLTNNYTLFIDIAILKIGDTFQGGIIYEISQAPNAVATGSTVAPNVSTGAWNTSVCTNFTGGGQNNWTMPAIGVLDTIWPLTNCNGGVIEGFSCATNIFYWSSTILTPPPPTNDGSFYVWVKNFGRNCDGADKNTRTHIIPCVRTF